MKKNLQPLQNKEAVRDKYKTRLVAMERYVSKCEADGEHRRGAIFLNAIRQTVEHSNPAYLNALTHMVRLPVTIDEFVESREFLGDVVDVWDTLRGDLRSMNPDILIGDSPINEVVLGGATSCGKTTLAQVNGLYDLYFLTCFAKPQKIFSELSADTPIVFMMQSVSATVTQRVIYKPFRRMFLAMPYAQRFVKYNKDLESALHLQGNIEVVCGLANEQSLLGQAIIGGVLDEVNFMNVVENSKQVAGPRGAGGMYDQARLVHRTITRRRKSRFITRGPSPGKLNVISSTRYKGDFLDTRVTEIEKNGEEAVFVSRRKQYEVQPPERYRGEKFRLLVGNESYETRVLGDDEQSGKDYPENATVENVPIEYIADFKSDPENALRDVIGIATDTLTPFISQRHKIVDSIVCGRGLGLKSWVVKKNTVLAEDGMPQIIEENLPDDREVPRYVHIDLSETSDRCGIAVAKTMLHQAVDGEMLPTVVIEEAVTIKPDKAHEIDIGDIRRWVTNIKNFYGINIVMVTFDGFNSKESQQILRKAGIRSKEISMDRTSEPYKDLRRALYQDRVFLADNDLLRTELVNLEHNQVKDKVDHPPRGSKDCADAVCGAYQAASKSRLVRSDNAVLTPSGEDAMDEMRQETRVVRRRKYRR